MTSHRLFFRRFSATISNSELTKPWVFVKFLKFFQYLFGFIKKWKIIFKLPWNEAEKLQMGWILVLNLLNYQLSGEYNLFYIVGEIWSFRIILRVFFYLLEFFRLEFFFGLEFFSKCPKKPAWFCHHFALKRQDCPANENVLPKFNTYFVLNFMQDSRIRQIFLLAMINKRWKKANSYHISCPFPLPLHWW